MCQFYFFVLLLVFFNEIDIIVIPRIISKIISKKVGLNSFCWVSKLSSLLFAAKVCLTLDIVSFTIIYNCGLLIKIY